MRVTVNAPAWPVRVFAEPDYCYGFGPLTLRVERVDWKNPVWYDNEEWYRVEGVEVNHDGVERRKRQVLVRAKRLPPPPPRRPAT